MLAFRAGGDVRWFDSSWDRIYSRTGIPPFGPTRTQSSLSFSVPNLRPILLLVRRMIQQAHYNLPPNPHLPTFISATRTTSSSSPSSSSCADSRVSQSPAGRRAEQKSSSPTLHPSIRHLSMFSLCSGICSSHPVRVRRARTAKRRRRMGQRRGETKRQRQDSESAIKKSGLPVMCMIYCTDHTIRTRPSPSFNDGICGRKRVDFSSVEGPASEEWLQATPQRHGLAGKN